MSIAAGGVILNHQYQKGLAEMAAKAPKPVKVVGVPHFGGPFSLYNKYGQTVTEKTHAGKFQIIYFGFTYCPDVCPANLSLIEGVLKMLADKGYGPDQVQFLFISVDPWRDTVSRLMEFSKNWDPRIEWLAGSPDDIKSVCKVFRSYYVPYTTRPKEVDYAMDHNRFFYILGPQFEPLNFIDPDSKATTAEKRIQMEQITGDIYKTLKEFTPKAV